MHSEALAAGVLAANALRGDGPAVEEPVESLEEPAPLADEPAAWAAVPGVWAGLPTEQPGSTSNPPPTMRWKTRGVPVGIGMAVVAAALFALVLGNPFGAGRVESAINPTNSPVGTARIGGAGAGVPSPGAEGSPIIDAPTDPTSTGPIVRSPNGPAQTPQPTAAIATPRPDATATPRTPQPGATPTPKPPATAAPTRTPSPTPTPVATPTPEPPPACLTVPDLVGMTVAKARGTWKGAGFTGAFTAPDGPGNQIVATQSQPAGACLLPGTSITVTI